MLIRPDTSACHRTRIRRKFAAVDVEAILVLCQDYSEVGFSFLQRLYVDRPIKWWDGRRARLQLGLCVKQPARQLCPNDGGDGKLQQTAPVQLLIRTAIVTVTAAEQRKHHRFRMDGEFHSSSYFDKS